jgi:hypothetical protein
MKVVNLTGFTVIIYITFTHSMWPDDGPIRAETCSHFYHYFNCLNFNKS